MFMLNFSNNALNFSHPTGGYQTGGLPAVQNGALQGFSWGDKNLPAVQDHAFDLGGPTGLPAVQYEPVDLGGAPLISDFFI